MKISKLTIGLCLVASTAYAQPPETTTPPPPPPTTTDPPPPPPTPAPTPTPPPTFVETKPVMTEPLDDYRPSAFSIGIGAGYDLPNSLETPNVTSVRFRLPSGVTFEPILRFQQQSVEIDVGESVKDKETRVELAALLRYPLRRRGRVDFEVLGGVGIENISTKPDEDTMPNMDETTTTFSAVYGIAVTAWITSHVNLSFSALNPAISVRKVDEEMGAGTNTVTTNSTFGAVFKPQVSLMVHLYY